MYVYIHVHQHEVIKHYRASYAENFLFAKIDSGSILL